MRKSIAGLEQLHKVVRISEMIESVNDMINYHLEMCEKKADGFYYWTERLCHSQPSNEILQFGISKN